MIFFSQAMQTVFVVMVVIVGIRFIAGRRRRWGGVGIGAFNVSERADPALLDQLDQQAAQIESMDVRLAELEDRLEFTERLLARSTRSDAAHRPSLAPLGTGPGLGTDGG